MSDLLNFIPEFIGVAAVVWIARASPRFRFRPIGFVKARRDGLVALGVWLLAFVLQLSLLTSLAPGEWINKYLPGGDNLLKDEILYGLIGLALAVVSMAYRRQPPKSAGWNRLTLRNGVLLGLALGLLTLLLRQRTNNVLDGITAAEGNAFLLAALIGLSEETFFRGFLQLRLDWWFPKPWGILLAAGLFVVWRLPLLLRAPETLWVNLVLTAVQSLLLAWIMKSSGSVAAPALYRTFSIWCTLL